MARENRRRREERRFGRAERLADFALEHPHGKWRLAPWITDGADAETFRCVYESIENLRASIEKAKVIQASNVGTYYFESPKDVWDLEEDFPGLMPLFESFFVEFVRPQRIQCEGQWQEETDCLPERWGWLFEFKDVVGDDRAFPTATPEGELITVEVADMTRWFTASLVVFIDGRPAYPGYVIFCGVGEHGEMLTGNPTVFSMGRRLTLDDRAAIGHANWPLFQPALLTISFMNCKNVTLDAVEPDTRLNRERQRHGLKPFLRYHTINIEPMKHVLRTEGNIESVGLKRALHICRGHFATYTKERPLFGHFVGTIWVPAHVRGSAKQGVVVSDYEVQAPRSETR